MNNSVDSILIKDKTGKIKQVSLGNKNAGIQENKNIKINNKPANTEDTEKFTENTKNKKIQSFQSKFSDFSDSKKIVQSPQKNPTPSLDDSENLVIAGEPEKAKASSFYFDLKDEEEVARFKDEKSLENRDKKNNAILFLIDDVVKQMNLNLSEDVLRRLKRALEARMRDIRTKAEARESLVKKFESGGVGLNDETASKILSEVEKRKDEVKDLMKKEIKAPVIEKFVNVGSRSPDWSQSVKSAENKQEVPVRGLEPTSTSDIKRMNDIRQASQPEVVSEDKPKNLNINNLRQQPWPQMPPMSFVPAQPTYTERRVFGPIEELSNFNVQMFVALNPKPEEAIRVIQDKIETLTSESYERKAEGIRAWKSSPIYTEYLELGEESIEKGKSVKDLISEKKNSNLPVMSYEIFEAIGDLNEELNY